MKYGVAIGMTPNGLKSVADIMAEHLSVGNKFYFSTSYRFDRNKILQLERVLFYSKAEQIFYIGDIERFISYGLDESRPEDAKIFSPKAYSEIPKRNWILVKNIEQVTLNNLHSLLHKNIPVDELIENAQRSTLFYFTED